MSDSPSSSSTRSAQPASRAGRPGSSPDAAHGPSSSRASVPPSEPRASRASFAALADAAERPARLQMIVAALLLLVLVAIPLYLWRRPRAASIAVSTERDAGEPPPPEPPPPEPKVALGAPKTIGCHDPGPKRTPPDQCDRLLDVERALAAAIQETVACVPDGAGGGSIGYVADVSFRKRSIGVITPRDARSIKNDKIVAACRAAVRARMEKVALDGIAKHEHARYRIEIVATY